jgi:CheY-like chemotaxis protein
VRAEAKGIRLVVTSDGSLPRFVVGDEGKLRQVLINLLGNAVKFTEKGAVTLRACWSGGRCWFEVEDTGAGISDEERGTIFQPFVQTQSGRQTKEGTGLGLVISRNIVRMLGGDIRVASEFGKGSVFAFDVNLPASDAVELTVDGRAVVGLEPGQPTCRILLLVKLLGAIGFEVREAATGQQALEVWRSWLPHLILMDIRMPVMDGREAIRTIRMEEGAEVLRVKVIALTASAFEYERDEILSCGADDFVTKPFREERLFEAIGRHTGVRFVYSEQAGEKLTGERPLTSEWIGALPADLVEPLRDALNRGDQDEAMLAVEPIRERDEALAITIARALQQYRYDELLSLVEAIRS